MACSKLASVLIKSLCLTGKMDLSETYDVHCEVFAFFLKFTDFYSK
jgi:hypothetical protein